jgi:hypothetical protein
MLDAPMFGMLLAIYSILKHSRPFSDYLPRTAFVVEGARRSNSASGAGNGRERAWEVAVMRST